MSTAAESAYRALRHYAPEAVRNIRAALDAGSTAGEVKALCLPRVAAAVRDRFAAAIDHMAAHPTAGTVVWAGMDYTWAEE